MKMKKGKYIIGIDEAGRGPLAGPVVVAAVLLPRNFQIKRWSNALDRDAKTKISPRGFIKPTSKPTVYYSKRLALKDSKKLTPRQREMWFEYIARITRGSYKNRGTLAAQRRFAICYATANVSPKIIDKINISNAANLAASRAFKKLLNKKLLRKKNIGASINGSRVFLDGGLYLKKNSIRINQFTPLDKLSNGVTPLDKLSNGAGQHKSASTIIKGDEKIPAIALASIVAKVSRDRLMKKLHKKYPKYGFSQHKGYGTKKHIKAIKKYGLSPIHRRSFRVR